MAVSKKLYTESYIQAIANAIRSKNGLTDTYKVSEMAAAIENIAVGISLETFIQNNLKTFLNLLGWTVNPLSGFYYFPDNEHFVVVPSKNGVHFTINTIGGNRTNGLSIEKLNISGAGQNNMRFNSQWNMLNNIMATGVENYYPFDSANYNITNIIVVDRSLTHPILDKELTVFNLDTANILPLFANRMNNNKLLLRDCLTGLKPNEIFNITGYGSFAYTKAYMMYANNRVYCAICDDNANVYIDSNDSVNSDSVLHCNGYITISGWYSSSMNENLHTLSATQTNVSPAICTQSEMLFNTADIKDTNGNVILPANCTLADFGL